MIGARIHRLLPLTLTLALVAVGAYAQTEAPNDPRPQAGSGENDPSPPGFSESVVVTANRLEQPASAVPASVIVFTSDDIQRSSAQTVDEFLLHVAGFSQLHQSDSHVAHPSTRTASLRGLGGGNSRTLVLVDGVPLNEPFGGVVYWSRIPLDSIERIEIIKSGAPGVWGNLALGGVIQIITKSDKANRPALSGTAEGGNNGTGNFSVGTQGSRGRLSTAATAAYYRSDGYLVIPADIAGPIDQPVSDATAAATGKVEYRPSANVSWTIGGNYYHERQHYGTPLDVLDVDIGSINGRGVIATPGGSRWQVTGFITHQNGANIGSTIAADRKSETLSTNQFDVPGTVSGGNVQWSKTVLSRQLVSVGGDTQWLATALFEDFNFSAGRLTRRRQANSHQLFQGVYAEDLVQMNARWHLVASARVDQWDVFNATRREVDIATENVLRDDGYSDRKETTVNPSLGTVVRVKPQLSLRGSVYRGFRAPTPNEMYRPFRSRGNVLTESNALLNPERLTGAEGGVDVTPGAGVQIKVTVFLDNLQNAITTQTIADAGASTRTIAPCGVVPAGGSCRQRANVGQLRSRGVESAVHYRPRAGWIFGLNYVYDPSRVVANPTQPTLVGLLNKQTSVHQLVLDGAYEDPRIANFSVMVRHIGSSFDDDLNTLKLSAFSTVDLRVSRRLTAATNAYLSIRNLSNGVIEATKAADGSIGLGAPRLINAGLSVRF